MTELTYTMQGDYNLPNLTMPEQPEAMTGRYAQMRKKYLKEHHRVLYYNLLTSCKLTAHLNEVQQRATEMEETLVKQMAQTQGVTEKLKAEDAVKSIVSTNHPLYSRFNSYYNSIVAGVQKHSKVPSFCSKATGKAQNIELEWDGSKYTTTLTDSNNVLANYKFTASQSGITFTTNGNKLTMPICSALIPTKANITFMLIAM